MSASAARESIGFSVCICTRNRPDALRVAIRSVACSRFPVHQLVVSDDSTDPATCEMVAREFPRARFVEGPRRGLSANRNAALAAITGSHVLFLDDDAILAPDFLARMAARIAAQTADADRLILTGTERNRGERVVAHKPTFLGFQALEYRPGERMCSIVINSTVFPAGVFLAMRFDENLIYGCEEMDFAARAVLLHGYRIENLPDAINEHVPAPANRGDYAAFVDASRIYVTFKRYYWLERRRTKAWLFLAIACAHNFLHNAKVKGPRGVAAFAATLRLSIGYIQKCFAAPGEFV